MHVYWKVTGSCLCMIIGVYCICDPPPPTEAQVGNIGIEVLTQCNRGDHWYQNGERIMFLS